MHVGAARRGSHSMGLDLYMNLHVGAIGEAGRDYAQDVRYIAKEHMDVRRDPV
jgi:hypothetical protein